MFKTLIVRYIFELKKQRMVLIYGKRRFDIFGFDKPKFK